MLGLLTITLIPLLYYGNTLKTRYAKIHDAKIHGHESLPIYAKFKNTSVVLSLCNEPDKKTRNNKVLSYSLFGNNSWTNRFKDALAAVAGEAENSTFYADWTVRIYHDEYLTSDRRNAIKSVHKNVAFCDVKKVPTLGDVWSKNAMVWRFVPIADFSVDVMCSRDLDSPILQREEDAIREWLASNKIMHVMRDHPCHVYKIQGGLWCFRNSKNREFGANILNIILRKVGKRTSKKEANKGNDQVILNVYIRPLVKNDTLQHDAYLCNKFVGSVPFPTKRPEGDKRFTGCVRPCKYPARVCPKHCRPKNHLDWEYC